MFWTLERVSGPELEPVTLAEARSQVREFDDITEHDTQLTALIQSAREWVESYTGRVLIDQTWRMTVGDVYRESVPLTTTTQVSGTGEDWRRTNGILLRKSPALAITSFQSVNSASEETAVDASHYELREGASRWPRLAALTGATWPTLTGGLDLQVTFRAGYVDRTGSPQQAVTLIHEKFRQAMLLHIEAHYNRDEMMDKLIMAAKHLLKNERAYVGFA